MPKTYSMDLRERVVAARDAGEPTGVVAKRFDVSTAWVRRLLQRRRETGSFEVLRTKRGPKPKLAAHMNTLRDLVDHEPDATLEELRSMLPVKVGIGTLCSALRQLGISRKKSYPRRGAAAA